MKTFFIADTHFDDENILIYENRPFASAREMNEAIIRNWNQKVTGEDTVFLVGDVGNASYVNLLNGHKRLIKGNHDVESNDYYRSVGFEEVYDLPVIYEGFFIISHEPLYVNTNMPYANIFGHVHANPNYCASSSHGVCVSVERTGYAPIDLAEIRKLITEGQRKGE